LPQWIQKNLGRREVPGGREGRSISFGDPSKNRLGLKAG